MGKNRSVILVNGFTVPPCFLSMPGAAGFLIVVVGTFTGLMLAWSPLECGAGKGSWSDDYLQKEPGLN